MPDVNDTLKLFEIPSCFEPKEGLVIHTQSSISCWQRCQQLYHNKYELGYRSVAPIAAYLIGSAVHIGLEYFWKGEPFAVAMGKAEAFMSKESYFKGDGRVEAARIHAYIKGYYGRWMNERHLYEVVGVELEFHRTDILSESITTVTAGKLDVLVRRKSDGQLIIIEHKTAGPYSKADEPGSPYWMKLSMDTQSCFYIDKVHKITGEMPLLMYDVVLKTRSAPLKSKARKKKDETPAQLEERKAKDLEPIPAYKARLASIYAHEGEKRYFRKIVNITQKELDRKRNELNSMMVDIDVTSRHPVSSWSRVRNTAACNAYGSTCEFMGVCTGVEQLNDPKFKKKETTHEELSQ